MRSAWQMRGCAGISDALVSLECMSGCINKVHFSRNWLAVLTVYFPSPYGLRNELYDVVHTNRLVSTTPSDALFPVWNTFKILHGAIKTRKVCYVHNAQIKHRKEMRKN